MTRLADEELGILIGDLEARLQYVDAKDKRPTDPHMLLSMATELRELRAASNGRAKLMTITKDDLEARIALARKATPGPWSHKPEWEGEHGGVDVVYGATGQAVCKCDEHDGGYGGGQRNVDYISAFSPDAVIALLEELRAMHHPHCGDKCEMGYVNRCAHCGYLP